MAWVIGKRSKLEIEPLIEQIIAAGQMNRKQHFQLASVILADQMITDKERRQINRAFDYLQTGRVRLID